MLRFLCLLALLFAPAPVFAGEVKQWVMDPATSTLAFKGKQMGAVFSGSFTKFIPDIRFDPDNLAASKVTVTVDIASINTGDAERDQNLKTKEWFDPEKFAEARFETTSFKKTGDNAFEAEANLTIRAITLPVVLPFTLVFSKDDSGKETALMTGSLTLNRSKFSLGTGDWDDPSIIANEVPVEISLNATAVQ